MNGDENSVVLRFLNSLTEYQITVFAIYSNSASEALRGSETTRESSVSDLFIWTSSFCVPDVMICNLRTSCLIE